MNDSVSAAITIRGEVLRHTVLEWERDKSRVQGVGRHDFEFDLGKALLGSEEQEGTMDPVLSVLDDVLAPDPVRTLAVAVHPPDVYSFFTPVAADASAEDRQRRIQQQVALMTGKPSAEPFRVVPTDVRGAQDSEGERLTWVHVLAVPTSADTQVRRLVDSLPVDSFTWTVTTAAAARALTRLRGDSTQEETQHSYLLCLGQYPTHTEFSVSRDDSWYHAQYTEEVEHPENQVYFAVEFLNRVEVPLDHVDQISTYGEAVNSKTAGSFERVLGATPQHVDPLREMQDPPALNGEDRSAYVPSVGAALGIRGNDGG